MTLAIAFGTDGRKLTLAERLEQCVVAAGGLNKAAEIMGMTPQGVRKMIRESAEGTGSKRGGPLLPIAALARQAGVSTDWIATGEERRRGSGPDGGRRDFAVLYHYEIGASGALIEVQDVHDAAVALRSDWLAAIGVAPDKVGLLTVKGDAMAPTLRDGALLVVDRSVVAITGDGIYALLTGRALAVRRAQILVDGSVKLIADNGTYAAETMAAEAIAKVKVAGRVRAAIVTL